MAKTSIPDPEDLDDEVDDEQPKASSRLIQWLIVMSLAIMFVPLFLMSNLIKNDTWPLQTQAADIDSTLSVTSGPNGTEKALNGTLVQLRTQAANLEAARPTLAAKRLDWPAAMAVIGTYNQHQVVLTALSQNDRLITVQGQANDENAVMEYAKQLKDSDMFVRVVVQGIAIKPSPTITPTATATATPSPTSTSLPGTKVNATQVVQRTPTSMGTQPINELSDKYASFTILLEAKGLATPPDLTASPTHS